MVSRRGFLTSMLALGAAPAIVRAASLMPVVTPSGLWSQDDHIYASYDLSTGENHSCIVRAHRTSCGKTVIDEIAYYDGTAILYVEQYLQSVRRG